MKSLPILYVVRDVVLFSNWIYCVLYVLCIVILKNVEQSFLFLLDSTILTSIDIRKICRIGRRLHKHGENENCICQNSLVLSLSSVLRQGCCFTCFFNEAMIQDSYYVKAFSAVDSFVISRICRCILLSLVAIGNKTISKVGQVPLRVYINVIPSFSKLVWLIKIKKNIMGCNGKNLKNCLECLKHSYIVTNGNITQKKKY